MSRGWRPQKDTAARRWPHRLRLVVFLMFSAGLLWTTPASAQKLIKNYVAKAKSARPKPSALAASARRPLQQKIKQRLASQAAGKRLLHKSEKHTIKHLGGGVHAMLIKSQLLPGQYDRMLLFKVDSAGRGKMLPTKTVFSKLVNGLPYSEVVSLWQDTVAVIKSPAYVFDPAVRVQVDTELRFLEQEISKRVARSKTNKLPWRTQLVDPVKELGKVGDGEKLAKALANGRRTEQNTLDMVARGIYRIHSPATLPRSEFNSMRKSPDMAGVPEVANAKASDVSKLRRKNSRLRKAVEGDIYGYQFAKQRSTLIIPRRFRGTVETIVHELNHGANRIPEKPSYTAEETLAFEYTAFASQRNMSAAERRALKTWIIDAYGLGKISARSNGAAPRGNRDNWVPKFPKGEEKHYTEQYFRDPPAVP